MWNPIKSVPTLEVAANIAYADCYYLRGETLYRGQIKIEDEVVGLIFLTPGIVEAEFETSNIISIDGTFKTVPSCASQLVTVNFFFQHMVSI